MGCRRILNISEETHELLSRCMKIYVDEGEREGTKRRASMDGLLYKMATYYIKG